jgi:hypothetical protein
VPSSCEKKERTGVRHVLRKPAGQTIAQLSMLFVLSSVRWCEKTDSRNFVSARASDIDE